MRRAVGFRKTDICTTPTPKRLEKDTFDRKKCINVWRNKYSLIFHSVTPFSVFLYMYICLIILRIWMKVPPTLVMKVKLASTAGKLRLPVTTNLGCRRMSYRSPFTKCHVYQHHRTFWCLELYLVFHCTRFSWRLGKIFYIYIFSAHTVS